MQSAPRGSAGQGAVTSLPLQPHLQMHSSDAILCFHSREVVQVMFLPSPHQQPNPCPS